MGIPACVVLGVFAAPIMRFWLEGSLGESYRVTAWVLAGWAAVDLFRYGGSTHFPVLLGMDRLNVLLWITVPLGLANLLASIALVGYTRLGVAGVVVATVVTAAVRRPIVAVYAARQAGLPLADYFRRAYAGPLVVLGLLLFVALGTRAVPGTASVASLVAACALVGAAWMPLCWFVGFAPEDRRRLLELAAGLRKIAAVSSGIGNRTAR
jgi:O-antigen/teichoic acid export membrane protein